MKQKRVIFLVTIVLVCMALSACGKTAQELVESGNNYMRQKEYDKAIEDYKDAISKDSQYMEAYQGVLEAYRLLKDSANVSVYCKKAFENLSSDQVRSINHNYYSYNLMVLDSIRSAVLDAIYEYWDDEEIGRRWVNKTVDISTLKKDDGNLSASTLNTLGIDNGKEVVADILIIGADSISIKAEVEEKYGYTCRVYVEGYESDLCVE